VTRAAARTKLKKQITAAAIEHAGGSRWSAPWKWPRMRDRPGDVMPCSGIGQLRSVFETTNTAARVSPHLVINWAGNKRRVQPLEAGREIVPRRIGERPWALFGVAAGVCLSGV